MSGAWEVGQEVILRNRTYRGDPVDEPAVIARVGRKYVYVQKGWAEIAFHADNGIEKAEGNYKHRIFTAAGLAEHDREQAARARLADATRGYGWANQLTADQAERIVAILVEEARP